MEHTTIFYNRISWLILTLVIIIFVLYIGGVIALFRKSQKMLDQEKHERIKKPILLVGCSGIGIIGLISSCWGTTIVPMLVISYKNEIVSCLEMPIADDYKFIIEDHRNGEREVHFEEYDGSQRYIWAITKFTILDEYMIGETSFLLYDRDYFWFNLNSKEFFDSRPKTDLGSMKEGVFLDSLGELGVFELPDMTSVEALCSNDECTPCKTHSLNP